jgi:pilus assembly protein CpaF
VIPSAVFSGSIEGFLEPIRDLLADPAVSEIMVNGPDEIWVERRGRLSHTDARFPSAGALAAALTNIAQYAGRTLGPASPILEAHLPDGSRVEAVLDPLAHGGPVVAIRRFSGTALTMERIVASGSLTAEAARLLERAVASKRNLVVSGGTGSGKTSLLGALSVFALPDERIIVIEDTREIRLQRSHVVHLETRSADEHGRGLVTIRDLLAATLRLRPDRIVVGEVRGPEAFDLVQAMNTGHGGSLTTIHANSPRDALRRLESLALLADAAMPLAALRAQVAAAVHVVVQVERAGDGRRRVSAIEAVRGLRADGEHAMTPLFRLDAEGRLARALGKDRKK